MINPEDINKSIEAVSNGVGEASKFGTKGLGVLERFLSPGLVKKEHEARLLEIAGRIKEGKAVIDGMRELREYSISQLGYSEMSLNNDPIAVERLKRELIEYSNRSEIYYRTRDLINEENLKRLPIDQDFHIDFQEKAGRIQNPKRQELWSRVYARKIEDENSFSRSTLSVLETMDAEDARLFEILTTFSFNNEIVLLPQTFRQFYEIFFSWEDRIRLQERGLVSIPTGLVAAMTPDALLKSLKYAVNAAKIGNIPIQIYRAFFNYYDHNKSNLDGYFDAANSIGLTRAGAEIALVTQKNDELTIKYLAYLEKHWKGAIQGDFDESAEFKEQQYYWRDSLIEGQFEN